ncbi:hypothetical protein [Pedobacter sp. MR2016-24]|uniref:hypothetical protein n=1 Tax=Pedobacter sp. MR2016-24 TaxID=2994466 RepID=UPI00224701EA|nr:hypothetical protein [Pedobacter sp. MR2016-24]MCX2483525.1 hypothetical protein [Pedobacter sp. MR2016-24]
MKTLKLLAVGLMATITVTAQTKKPLPDSAFNRMIVQDITYAIAGENTPVTGLKVDIYILPLISFVPGLYLSGNISQSDLYHLNTVIGRADDNVKVGGEGGLIFNINNRDKDKTLLSIISYFRYEDLTDSRRTSIITSIQESKDDFQQRNISFGVKVGIPITLPKKQCKILTLLMYKVLMSNDIKVPIDLALNPQVQYKRQINFTS